MQRMEQMPFRTESAEGSVTAAGAASGSAHMRLLTAQDVNIPLVWEMQQRAVWRGLSEQLQQMREAGQPRLLFR